MYAIWSRPRVCHGPDLFSRPRILDTASGEQRCQAHRCTQVSCEITIPTDIEGKREMTEQFAWKAREGADRRRGNVGDFAKIGAAMNRRVVANARACARVFYVARPIYLRRASSSSGLHPGLPALPSSLLSIPVWTRPPPTGIRLPVSVLSRESWISRAYRNDMIDAIYARVHVRFTHVSVKREIGSHRDYPADCTLTSVIPAISSFRSCSPLIKMLMKFYGFYKNNTYLIP